MIRSKIIKYFLVATLFTGFSLTSIHHKHTKNRIDEEIIFEVNDIDFLKNPSVKNIPDTKIISSSPLMASETKDEVYTVNINDISNGKLKRTTIDESTFYTYNFKANLTLSKDEHEYNKEIKSTVILDKNNNEFTLRSLSQLKDDISQEIMMLKNENSEDISKELEQLSLLYENTYLDIRINYPQYYSYTNTSVTEHNNEKNTVSFYMDDSDKSNNYVSFNISTEPTLSVEDIYAELLSQNYIVIDESFTTPKDLTFKVYEQSFIKDSKEIVENVYVLEKPYKNINELVVKVKVDYTNKIDKQKEIEEIIKSFN